MRKKINCILVMVISIAICIGCGNGKGETKETTNKILESIIGEVSNEESTTKVVIDELTTEEQTVSKEQITLEKETTQIQTTIKNEVITTTKEIQTTTKQETTTKKIENDTQKNQDEEATTKNEHSKSWVEKNSYECIEITFADKDRLLDEDGNYRNGSYNKVIKDDNNDWSCIDIYYSDSVYSDYLDEYCERYNIPVSSGEYVEYNLSLTTDDLGHNLGKEIFVDKYTGEILEYRRLYNNDTGEYGNEICYTEITYNNSVITIIFDYFNPGGRVVYVPKEYDGLCILSYKCCAEYYDEENCEWTCEPNCNSIEHGAMGLDDWTLQHWYVDDCFNIRDGEQFIFYTINVANEE